MIIYSYHNATFLAQKSIGEIGSPTMYKILKYLTTAVSSSENE